MRIATLRFGSNSVTTVSLVVVRPPNDRTTARLVDPTPTGPGEVSASSTALDDHFGVSAGFVSTAKTSSTGRSIVIAMRVSVMARSAARVVGFDCSRPPASV